MKRTGYAVLDHRGTQGVILRDGRHVLSGKDGQLEERDTVLCCHCQTVLRFEPGSQVPMNAELCGHCGRYRCRTEACSICTPFMGMVDRAEDRAYHREQFARAVGLEG
jgi:hypothetical protein